MEKWLNSIKVGDSVRVKKAIYQLSIEYPFSEIDATVVKIDSGIIYLQSYGKESIFSTTDGYQIIKTKEDISDKKDFFLDKIRCIQR